MTTDNLETAYFRQCSICKKSIAFEHAYYECSVSTCNRKRNPLFFCSVECWDAHVPMMRHRDAWAVATRSPTRAEWERQRAEQSEEDEEAAPEAAGEKSMAERPQRRIVGAETGDGPGEQNDDDVLVVVSKVKKHVRTRSGMNTSDGVMPVLSAHVRELCNEAIRNAARDGRKTVLDRDLLPLLKKIREP